MHGTETHSICWACHAVRYPERVALPIQARTEACCFCGSKHDSGLYVVGSFPEACCRSGPLTVQFGGCPDCGTQLFLQEGRPLMPHVCRGWKLVA